MEKNDKEQKVIMEAINCIYTDFRMLLDDTWNPDGDPSAAEDSIQMVERIADALVRLGVLPAEYNPVDTRDEEQEEKP